MLRVCFQNSCPEGDTGRSQSSSLTTGAAQELGVCAPGAREVTRWAPHPVHQFRTAGAPSLFLTSCSWVTEKVNGTKQKYCLGWTANCTQLGNKM